MEKPFEFDDQPRDILSFAFKASLIYRLTENKCFLVYLNLKNVISQVENKLKDFGVEDNIIKTSRLSL